VALVRLAGTVLGVTLVLRVVIPATRWTRRRLPIIRAGMLITAVGHRVDRTMLGTFSLHRTFSLHLNLCDSRLGMISSVVLQQLACIKAFCIQVLGLSMTTVRLICLLLLLCHHWWSPLSGMSPGRTYCTFITKGIPTIRRPTFRHVYELRSAS
jgi:hypothetical protein